MPSVQRGQVVKRGKRWGARFYDEAGARRFQGGFETKTAARDWLDNRVNEVASVRRGDTFVMARDRPQTIDTLLDTFLEKHGRTVDPGTERKLRAQLKHARHVRRPPPGRAEQSRARGLARAASGRK